MFLPRGVSDHSPSLLSFKGGIRKRRWGFKFDNYLVHHKHFLPIVSDVWQKRVDGTFMFQVTQKLKALKKPLRSLRNTYGDLNLRAVKLKTELDVIQIAADMDPFNVALREDLEFLRVAYQQARHDEEVAIMQRAKVKWLKDGDANTKYFHMVVKEKRNAQQIHSVRKVDGMFVYDDDVPGAFVDNLKALLGTRDDTINPDMPNQFFVNTLSLAESLDMIRPISDADIRHAMFSIGNDKAPGSDGFSATFFKAAWNVIGPEVMRAIHSFFYRSRLDKEINHTLLCLLPKSPNASSITDFRPISCCTVLYKCISKILVDRIKPYLDGLVSRSQSTFIPGRRIVDNILMAHELVVGYHLQVGQPRCAFKIDIRKAYDMVDWRFLFNMLSGVGFHPALVRWIKEMVTSTSYSIALNGETHGFFKGERGIRQGDPLSPYLFTLLMEGFSMIFRECIREALNFGYHPGCAELEITHLCFADDLFVFTRGDVGSVDVLKRALQVFSTKSGLHPSLEKSEVFFGNVPPETQTAILESLEFKPGVFPIRYLGVPLSPISLKVAEYGGLIAKVKARINNWKTKFLSFGGRKQLVSSVLQSLHLYWMAVFLFPSAVVYELEALCRDFLWAQGNSSKGKCKVAWDMTVADLFASMHREWPTDWLSRFPQLAGNVFPALTNDLPDSLCWDRDDSGVFLVRNAYNSIIGNFDETPWWRTVWFKGHIPKHAFCLWIACVRRLPTQDRITIWKHEPPDLVCPLCGDGPDSHTHLFFTCVFAKEVWSAIRVRMEWEDFPDSWDDIMVAISDPVTSPKGLARKLFLAASVYAIWRERNKRLFRGDTKSTHAIISEISEVVRLRVAWKMSKDKQHDDFDAALLDAKSDCIRDHKLVLKVKTKAKSKWSKKSKLALSFSGEGFSRASCVADVLNQIGGGWPNAWIVRAPVLQNQNIPTLSDAQDAIVWKNDQVLGDFSITGAYFTFLGHNTHVPWSKVVWVKGYIPKHALCVWMAILNRLPTQDRLISWKHIPPDSKCFFCNACVETDEHLFFNCVVLADLWRMVRLEVDLSSGPMNISHVHDDLLWNDMQKLAFSATVYMVWRERNARLFRKIIKPMETLFKEIQMVVIARMAWKNRRSRNVRNEE
ncbi:hypothetical protein OSB04_un000295 [Centaurea solstitialis]|uniref:Reverse transcriptase domain-containing protein n=2 Tax=Centaurea solstitialis TaxID=347529 RepID=A0AA38SQT1_9ASTR|nr:hypothetical protein OSB04_un000295 [Centaurea solstitialis]